MRADQRAAFEVALTNAIAARASELARRLPDLTEDELLDLAETWAGRERTTKVQEAKCDTLLKALQDARSELGPVEKTGVNKFHGYAFVEAEELFAMVKPVLDKHGLLIFQDIDMTVPPRVDEKGNTHITFLFWIYHVSGEMLETPIRVFASGCDRDSNGQWQDKGAYKANTGAWKYFFLRLFTLDSGEHEPENDAIDAPGTQPVIPTGRLTPTRVPGAYLPDHPGEDLPVGKPGSFQPPPLRVPPVRPPLVRTKPDDAPCSETDIKNSKIFKMAFSASERFFGDDKDRKFWALDWACAQIGIRGPREATTGQLRELVTLVTRYNGELPTEPEQDKQGEDIPF